MSNQTIIAREDIGDHLQLVLAQKGVRDQLKQIGISETALSKALEDVQNRGENVVDAGMKLAYNLTRISENEGLQTALLRTILEKGT